MTISPLRDTLLSKFPEGRTLVFLSELIYIWRCSSSLWGMTESASEVSGTPTHVRFADSPALEEVEAAPAVCGKLEQLCSKLQDEFGCAICYNMLYKPKVLPCGHAFCCGCHATTILQDCRNDLKESACPVCRKAFRLKFMSALQVCIPLWNAVRLAFPLAEAEQPAQEEAVLKVAQELSAFGEDEPNDLEGGELVYTQVEVFGESGKWNDRKMSRTIVRDPEERTMRLALGLQFFPNQVVAGREGWGVEFVIMRLEEDEVEEEGFPVTVEETEAETFYAVDIEADVHASIRKLGRSSSVLSMDRASAQATEQPQPDLMPDETDAQSRQSEEEEQVASLEYGMAAFQFHAEQIGRHELQGKTTVCGVELVFKLEFEVVAAEELQQIEKEWLDEGGTTDEWSRDHWSPEHEDDEDESEEEEDEEGEEGEDGEDEDDDDEEGFINDDESLNSEDGSDVEEESCKDQSNVEDERNSDNDVDAEDILERRAKRSRTMVILEDSEDSDTGTKDHDEPEEERGEASSQKQKLEPNSEEE
ncbi:hypothetical protein CYMTET_52233 [Cymbomonas tetramitiformis]|uniref:RING-type domain-containing protein n=1 Tax=Cymbomonas tetramitiformis TaxID=36881 RepID=A0AAE0BKV9_9CHLO|nr:hypothetical protein CYMTET_52233 [Cymbomonas tetramitiformis]